MKKTSPSPLASPFAMPLLMAELAAASWETIFHRTMLMAQGACSAAEFERMVMEKAAASQAATTALIMGQSQEAIVEPFLKSARANARRLRRSASYAAKK
jgi:hypothetical protein